ncbi:MAG: hypothetical protein U1F27_07115 [Turneriella sp.]
MTKRSTVFRSTLIYFAVTAVIFVVCAFALLLIPASEKFENELLLGLIKATSTVEMRKEIESHEITLRQTRTRASEPAIVEARNKLRFIAEQSSLKKPAKDIISSLVIRFVVGLAVISFSIVLIMFIILRLILIPLDRLILGAQQVSHGNLRVDFKGLSDSHPEIAGLATVLQNLTINFGEMMFIMGNAVEQGKKNLELIKSGAPNADEAIRDFAYLLQSMDDMVQYFRSRQ